MKLLAVATDIVSLNRFNDGMVITLNRIHSGRPDDQVFKAASIELPSEEWEALCQIILMLNHKRYSDEA